MQQNRWTWGLDGRRRLTGWEDEIDWRADRGCSRVVGLGGQIAAAGRCGWGQDRNSKVGGSDGWGQRDVLLGSRQAQTGWTDICLVLCNLGSRGGAAVFAGFKSWFKSWTSTCPRLEPRLEPSGRAVVGNSSGSLVCEDVEGHQAVELF